MRGLRRDRRVPSAAEAIGDTAGARALADVPEAQQCQCERQQRLRYD
jgi:hypothetical protein